MFWFGKPRNRAKPKVENLCHVCGENQLSDTPSVLRLKVQDGVAEMNVCDDCANFFDKSAEVLRRRGKGKKRDEPV